MRPYDQAFIDHIRAELAPLDPEMEPAWGSMRPPQMFAHMAVAIGYSLGREEETPNEGGLLGHYILRPLLFNGIIPMPKNAKAPKMYDAAAPHASLDELMEVAQAFQDAYAAKALPQIDHPFFGRLSDDGWARLHVLHFKHHLAQFGLEIG